MIITRTPFRVPLGGGGTDLPIFYKKHGGFLLSACIDKFMYVAVNRSASENVIRVTHSDAEVAENLEEVKHDLAREAMKAARISAPGLEIASFADMPPGTGLGSSGSYLVGVLRALHQLQDKQLYTEDLAELACRIEIEILKKPVGKQDQYLAAFGGFVCLEIASDGKVNVSRPNLSPELISELAQKALMFYTYKRHNTVEILNEQSKNAAIPESRAEKAMLEIKEIGHRIKAEMEAGRLKNLGTFMHQHWLTKKTITPKMSDGWLDKIYNLALEKGAEGGKIMGSGGGGCFLFFVPQNQPGFIAEMEALGLRYIPYKFWPQGAEVIYDNEKKLK